MTYFTENAVPGILIFGCLAVICWLSGSQSGKKISLLCVACAVGMYFLEKSLISTGEEVEAATARLLQSFKDEDLNAIGNQIIGRDPELVSLAERGLKLVDLGSDFQLKSVETSVSDDGKSVTAYIRANGRIEVTNHAAAGGRHVPTYWKTVWELEGKDWKLKNATRLNPADGGEIDLFGKQ